MDASRVNIKTLKRLEEIERILREIAAKVGVDLEDLNEYAASEEDKKQESAQKHPKRGKSDKQ